MPRRKCSLEHWAHASEHQRRHRHGDAARRCRHAGCGVRHRQLLVLQAQQAQQVLLVQLLLLMQQLLMLLTQLLLLL